LLRARHDSLIDALIAYPRRASEARIRAVKPIAQNVSGEICLFVTHSATASLKPHVVYHSRCLAEAGFAVVLMVNADSNADGVSIAPDVLARLAGVYVRENLGFDFGGWGHAWALGEGFPARRACCSSTTASSARSMEGSSRRCSAVCAARPLTS
jgi:hypothetical protein